MVNSKHKAVILARGLGTRMRAATNDAHLDAAQLDVAAKGLKALMPIGDGRVLLDVILESLRAAGAERICLVIGPEHDDFREFCKDRGHDVAFAVQNEPLGTADAVLAAENFAENEPFVVVNSDNLYPVATLAKLFALETAGMIGFSIDALTSKGNIPAERVAKFATIETDADGFLTKIVEKPESFSPQARVSMNAWRFTPEIFGACRSIGISPRGEYEITAAVGYAIDQMGVLFTVVESDEGVLDLSSRADVASVIDYLREK